MYGDQNTKMLEKTPFNLPSLFSKAVFIVRLNSILHQFQTIQNHYKLI
jgi:hypothetical protein